MNIFSTTTSAAASTKTNNNNNNNNTLSISAMEKEKHRQTTTTRHLILSLISEQNVLISTGTSHSNLNLCTVVCDTNIGIV
jgi:hypothetical protein